MAADPALFEELLAFVMARAKHRKSRAVVNRDWEHRDLAKREMDLIVALAADVRTHPWAMAEGIEWLRSRAVRDSNHPDYDLVWKPKPT